MKVLFITNAFYESTFPLVKKLKKNTEVSLLCVQTNNLLAPPEFDCSFLKYKKYGLYNAIDFTNQIQKNILNYFDNDIDFIKILYSKSVLFSITRILKFIALSKPDIIHFIGITIPFSVISRLVNQKVFFSIHEYTMNRLLIKNSFKSKFKHLVNHLIEFNVYSNKRNKFIFHSKNQLDQFETKFHSASTRLINFGTFETFKSYDKMDFRQPFLDYLVFVGSPKYYKGLDILIDFITSNHLNFNVVVAGSGVSKFKKSYDKGNFHFIDKFLEGHELCNLIKNSSGVILPYRSASQSGLPSLCMALNTPVITTAIPGILEYLEPDWNSIIIDFNDVSESNILCSEEALHKKLNELKSKIKIRPYIEAKFDWAEISKNTLDYYMN